VALATVPAINLVVRRVLQSVILLASNRAMVAIRATSVARIKRRKVAELRICWNWSARVKRGPKLEMRFKSALLWRRTTPPGSEVDAASRDILAEIG
jgi:hypothetical protein